MGNSRTQYRNNFVINNKTTVSRIGTEQNTHKVEQY